jgi:hypothetical protein
MNSLLPGAVAGPGLLVLLCSGTSPWLVIRALLLPIGA